MQVLTTLIQRIGRKVNRFKFFY